MKIYGVLVMIIPLISLQARSQQVEWAHEVIDFSAEASPIGFSSKQVLGKPDVLPATDMSPNAWSPGSAKNEHFITVGFKEPLKIRQTAIAEAYNPGAIKAVYAIDSDNIEHLLYSLKPKPSEQRGRMFNFFMSQTDFEVVQLKLVFDGQTNKGQFFIDAIAISDSDIPIRAAINKNKYVKDELVIQALGQNINSPSSEIRPLLSPDGKSLFFSRKNAGENIGGDKDEEDIWISTFNEQTQTWDRPKNAGAPLNNKGKNSVNALTSYGNMTLAILGNEYGKGDKMKDGISVSNTSEDGWSQPVAVDFSSDPNLSGNYDFTMSSDRKQIIIAVGRNDSYGGKDLYVSFLQRTAVWSEPLNLGSILNTASDESTPFLDADGKTLYFSSKGFSGFGQSDIYASERLDDSWQNWSEPQNLGPDINSEYDDEYFNIPSKGGYAYFSRFIEPDNADIHRVALPIYKSAIDLIAINASIVDESTGKPVESKVTLNRNLKMTGNSFKVDMEGGEIYRCRVEADGYLVHDELIDLTGRDVSESLDIEIKLKKKEEVITFEDINFATSQAMLLEQSFASLNEIARIIKENPGISLEIASHTDDVGPEDQNLELSKLRAEVIRGYLVEQGADPNRIKLAWHGESQPVASNETEEGRRKNRRVEFIFKR